MSSDLTRLRRHPERGSHDPAVVADILDRAPYCHLALAPDGQPLCVPTIHARLGDRLYVHGSAASRTLRALAEGAEVCLTATIMDGLVLARGAFYHSMNYRSAMVFGRGAAVDDRPEKLAAMAALVDRMVAGRWAEVRQPSEKELDATLVIRIPIERASAKIRLGPPKDPVEDESWPVWAGVVPVVAVAGTPLPASNLPPVLAPPARSRLTVVDTDGGAE